MTANSFSAPAPVARRVRAYFAPVDRAAQTPVYFDPSEMASFALDAPPAPWIDLGYIQNFTRKSASKQSAVLTGIPAAALEQTRESLGAVVSLEFLSWTKLTMALATGSQHMNVLATGNEGKAAPAVAVLDGSTASTIRLAAGDLAGFVPGSMIAVDNDYAGQTGFVGSPVCGAYVRQPLDDVDYIRRITFNVGLVLGVSSGRLILAQPLAGGVPGPTAKLQAITGFADREGGSFFHEWSAILVMQGAQGERIFFYYPRLQSLANAEEATSPLDARHKGALARILLKGQFLALPVVDPVDRERVVCYRSFMPAAFALI